MRSNKQFINEDELSLLETYVRKSIRSSIKEMKSDSSDVSNMIKGILTMHVSKLNPSSLFKFAEQISKAGYVRDKIDQMINRLASDLAGDDADKQKMVSSRANKLKDILDDPEFWNNWGEQEADERPKLSPMV